MKHKIRYYTDEEDNTEIKYIFKGEERMVSESYNTVSGIVDTILFEPFESLINIGVD